jgi:hypothetical protein
MTPTEPMIEAAARDLTLTERQREIAKVLKAKYHFKWPFCAHIAKDTIEPMIDVALTAALAASDMVMAPREVFQARIDAWMRDVFAAGGADIRTRIDRLIEEVFKLAQALDYEPSRVGVLRDYVFHRPIGEKGQGVGGVMVTLASLACAAEIDMEGEAEKELARIHLPEVRAKIMANHGLMAQTPQSEIRAGVPL